MGFIIEGCCCCHQGKIREKNEDNFYFDGKYLAVQNRGLKEPLYIKQVLNHNIYMAVFDGMGGEYYGEIASYEAAYQMYQKQSIYSKFFPIFSGYLNKLTVYLNDRINRKKEELLTDRMGSTMVALCFSSGKVSVCNIGDSRAYRFRRGVLSQLSQDHIINIPMMEYKKAPLIQCLGIDASEMRIEPYIFRERFEDEDQYLLCSDGLTDMLTDTEISYIMERFQNVKACVEVLLQTALDRGGNDNITIIVCKIMKSISK